MYSHKDFSPAACLWYSVETISICPRKNVFIQFITNRNYVFYNHHLPVSISTLTTKHKTHIVKDFVSGAVDGEEVFSGGQFERSDRLLQHVQPLLRLLEDWKQGAQLVDVAALDLVVSRHRVKYIEMSFNTNSLVRYTYF